MANEEVYAFLAETSTASFHWCCGVNELCREGGRWLVWTLDSIRRKGSNPCNKRFIL